LQKSKRYASGLLNQRPIGLEALYIQVTSKELRHAQFDTNDKMYHTNISHLLKFVLSNTSRQHTKIHTIQEESEN